MKAIIISVSVAISGFGLMQVPGKTANTVGGGIFIIGLILIALSLYSMITRKK